MKKKSKIILKGNNPCQQIKEDNKAINMSLKQSKKHIKGDLEIIRISNLFF